MEKRLTPEEHEAFFHEIVRKMPMVHAPAKLEELAGLALAMTLRREGSRDLRDELAHQIKTIIAAIKPGSTPEATAAATREAAEACIKVLEVAKAKRQPRPPVPPAHPAPHHSAAKHDAHPAHHIPKTEISDNKLAKIVIGVTCVLVLAGGAVWWSGAKDTPSSDGTEIARFVEQITKAAQGEAPATHMFGGALKISSMGGIPVVTAHGVPPSVCAASGMRLVKKGLLSVNGVTPNRVSSAIITELCNKEDGDATIMWAPK